MVRPDEATRRFFSEVSRDLLETPDDDNWFLNNYQLCNAINSLFTASCNEDVDRVNINITWAREFYPNLIELHKIIQENDQNGLSKFLQKLDKVGYYFDDDNDNDEIDLTLYGVN